jgi:hypothetical protein
VSSAALLAAVIFVIGTVFVPSDMPGFVYVPALYGLITLPIVLAVGLVVMTQEADREPIE